MNFAEAWGGEGIAATLPCVCGHAPEVHDGDPENGTACTADDCDCLEYEPNFDGKEDDP